MQRRNSRASHFANAPGATPSQPSLQTDKPDARGGTKPAFVAGPGYPIGGANQMENKPGNQLSP